MMRFKLHKLKDLAVGTPIEIDVDEVKEFTQTSYGSSGTSRYKVKVDPDMRWSGFVVKQNAKSTVIMMSCHRDGGQYFYDGNRKKFVSVSQTFDSYTVHHNDTFLVRVYTYPGKHLLPVDKTWYGSGPKSIWEAQYPRKETR